MKFLLSLLIMVASLGLSKVAAYEHRSQADWYDMPNECSLHQQSPIELSSSEALELNGIPALVFENYNIPFINSAVLSNNGHSADIQLPKRIIAPSITGGPLNTARYITESIHCHWGSRDAHGSEHVIDSERFSMEMHIVHRNSKYATVDEATQHEDGLAVLGILFQVEPFASDFEGLNNIVAALPYIRDYSQSTEIDSINLSDLLGDIPTSEFFTYQGSLTTPPCSEAVTWIVFPNVINLSSNQMNAFRLLTDSHGEILVNNYRHLQAKGTRPVYLCQTNQGFEKLIYEF